MNMDDYQALAATTANQDLDKGQLLANMALGLAGEAGEAADLIKKHLFHGHPLNEERLVKELGDVLWYVAMMARALGRPLGEVAEINVAKLKERYPEGFSVGRSLERSPE